MRFRQDAGKFHGVGCHEQEPHSAAAGLAGRGPAPRPAPPPALRNHSTARVRAASAGPGLKPSSRRAFSWVTHIFFRAMRTPFRGTRGGLPVRSAHAVLHTPAHQATAYGSRRVGAWRPVIFASFAKISASVKFSDPRMYRS